MAAPRRQFRDDQLTVALTADERKTLERAAELDRRPVSTYMRVVALAQAAKDLGDAK